MSDGRRLRVREQGSTRDNQKIRQKVRSRNRSISTGNEESNDGEENNKTFSRKKEGKKIVPVKDETKGLRTPKRKNKLNTSLAEKDVIDGFLILSFATYQDLEVRELFFYISLSFPQESTFNSLRLLFKNDCSLKINELNQSSQAGVIFFQLNSC